MRLSILGLATAGVTFSTTFGVQAQPAAAQEGEPPPEAVASDGASAVNSPTKKDGALPPDVGGTGEDSPPTADETEGNTGSSETELDAKPPAEPRGSEASTPPAVAATPKRNALPQPEADKQQLAAQTAGPTTSGTGASAANSATLATPSQTVFAEDWWSNTRPVVEFHGYYRLRSELFHNFSLGLLQNPADANWAQPSDNRFTPGQAGEIGPDICTQDEAGVGDSTDPADGLFDCSNKTQAGANMRLRLNPEIHVSDNLRIKAQVDLLDNLGLGTTPDGFAFSASPEGGLAVRERSGYNPSGFYDTTQEPPDSGRNNITDSIRIKRAWGEYTTPLGEFRFGRMPDHWGLGMLYHSGDSYDDDFGSHIDRLMFTTAIKSLDLKLSASWDFINEGAQGSIPIPGASPFDRASLDDVNQFSFMVEYRKPAELTRYALSRQELVFNAGLYFKYRDQALANDRAAPGAAGGAVPGGNLQELANAFTRRDAVAYVPDLWLQILYGKFRFELEAAAILGSIGSPTVDGTDFANSDDDVTLSQFGVVAELENKFVEDRLSLGMTFGYATGDDSLAAPTGGNSLIPTVADEDVGDDNTDSTFRFHPNFRQDYILSRNILQRIQGTHFFRPNVSYDFVRDMNGTRLGGKAQAVWTRASETVQTGTQDANLGIELGASLYFQAKDGSLNDGGPKLGGFYTELQYAALFPLAGLQVINGDGTVQDELDTAQLLRWYLGIHF